ncbi:MAG: DUF4856 domain-containing protein [Weeksellaceae bacterium]
MTNIKLLALLGVGLLFTSCDSDDDNGKKDKEVNVPQTYSFERDGNSTVDFNGQNTRLKMAKEIVYGAMGDFENITESRLQAMLNHQEGSADFEEASLNASGKSILSKIAASKELFSENSVLSSEIKNDFKSWITDFSQNVVPNYEQTASAGQAGQVVVGEKTRYVNADGLEMNQVIAKSFMGALIADQSLNNYLSPQVLDAGDNVINNDKDVVKDGKSYTTMEHKWDEAYGYIFGGEVTNEADPYAEGNGKHNPFLHGYSKSVGKNENFAGIENDIFNAFKKGRAAIVAKNYEVRNEQAKILQEKISTVIAVRGIHYLISGKEKIEAGERTSAFHALSEAYGFVYSLQFTHNPNTNQPYLSHEEVTNLINKLEAGNGLWDVTPATLQEIAETIAAQFTFTVEQAK